MLLICPQIPDGVGPMPHPLSLPEMPTFNPVQNDTSGLKLLAAAAASSSASSSSPTVIVASPGQSLMSLGPFNLVASLPMKLVKRILDLEFIEMVELTVDAWQEESSFDSQNVSRCPSWRAPITDISLWLECYSRVAAILVTHKGPELWAYQASILKATRNYEGSAWAVYDHHYRHKASARKDLNWLVTDPCLYNEAFAGRPKAIANTA